MDLPKIEHADVTVNKLNRLEIRMKEGYGFWRRDMYLNEKGEMYVPTAEKLKLSVFGMFPFDFDFNLFVIEKITNETEDKEND